ncbi:MAG: class I SAM-dependent methyltransferase [Proteobacteria bacterium]|jgi:SAM-dependent methyltransferase|nr:class I SAM-dependent methyltransferase [Pseudomonadota bacterium]
MAHPEQFQYFDYIRSKFPSFFSGTKVLDVGSLDINGCNRPYFKDCNYTGLDIAPGKNVDIVSLGHEFLDPDESYDVVVSANAFEHDMHFEKTFFNMVRLLKRGGLLFFSCAGEGHAEHGTARTSPHDAPFLMNDPVWSNYYRNVDEVWIRSFIDINTYFSSHEFQYETRSKDLRFWGLKR